MYNDIRMKKKIKRHTKPGKTHRKSRGRAGRIANLQAVADDWGVSPPDLAGASGWYRPIKKPVTLRLDADVLAWFKARGRGYQTRINRTLREVMLRERKSRSRR